MRTRRELTDSGIDDDLIASRVRAGDYERIRRGAYRMFPAESLTPEERHLELLRASLAQTRTPGTVATDVSAAVLHGLPIDQRHLTRAHLLREGPAHSSAKGPVWRHHQPEFDTTIVDGVPTTTVAATALGLARRLPFDEAVAIADVALRSVPRHVLLQAVDERPGVRGMRRARRVFEFADARTGSAGESRSRARMAELGLPPPDDLQFRVVDRHGVMFTDFVWEAQRIVGEFDGAVKYGRLLKPGDEGGVAAVLLQEKEREQRLRRQRWWAIRWVWADLFRPQQFARLITEGLAYWDFAR